MTDLLHVIDGNRQYLLLKWLYPDFRVAAPAQRLELSYIVIEAGVIIKNRYSAAGGRVT